MSGSGGSGFGGGYNDTAVACENLIIETQLSSPKEAVVKHLAVNDVLQVGLEQQAGTTVVVLTFHGDKAGGTTSPRMPQLRECIQGGTLYIATVTSKSDGQVQVRITPIRH